MKTRIKFSLKSVFVITAIVAIGVYWVPLENEINCDYLRLAGHGGAYEVKRIDLEGRNGANVFEPVIEDVELLSVSRSNDPRLGQWTIKIRTNLHTKVRLKEYKILRFRNAKK